MWIHLQVSYIYHFYLFTVLQKCCCSASSADISKMKDISILCRHIPLECKGDNSQINTFHKIWINTFTLCHSVFNTSALTLPKCCVWEWRVWGALHSLRLWGAVITLMLTCVELQLCGDTGTRSNKRCITNTHTFIHVYTHIQVKFRYLHSPY